MNMRSNSFDVFDERFRKLLLLNASLERLHTGCRWAEGPAWFGAGKYLVWSDIPNDRVLRWDETDGSVSVFQSPSMHANGHTVDHNGRLISCEHSGRCVSRIEYDGSRTVLAAEFEGNRFNSPNDVVVHSSGSIWFTDPTYGIDSDYEGYAASSEMPGNRVYRLCPQEGRVSVAISDFVQPNGLAFSPNEDHLYVVDSGFTHLPDGPRHVRRFSIDAGGKLSGGEVFATCDAGLFDGLKVDKSGNLWLSAGDGVHCYSNDGTLLGKIYVPETVANLCFGGPRRNRIFICATTSLYSIYLNTRA
jgi:gluconolactonase